VTERRRRKPKPIFEEEFEESVLNPEANPPRPVSLKDIEDKASDAETEIAEELPIERDILPPEVKDQLLNDDLDQVREDIVFKDSPLEDLLENIIGSNDDVDLDIPDLDTQLEESLTDFDPDIEEFDPGIDTAFEEETDKLADALRPKNSDSNWVSKDREVIQKPTFSSEIEEEPESESSSGGIKGRFFSKLADFKENIQDSVGQEAPSTEGVSSAEIFEEEGFQEEALDAISEEISEEQPLLEKDLSEEELVKSIQEIVETSATEEEAFQRLAQAGIDPVMLGLGPDPIAEEENAVVGDAPYVAIKRAYLAGNNVLPLELPNPKDEIDEINHALSTFADLQYGQSGFIKFSVRANTEFQQVATNWITHRKAGVDPDGSVSIPAQIIAWIQYVGAYTWYAANSQQKKGHPPPQKPQSRGKDLTPLPANQVSDEEKSNWKAALDKSKENNHFEVVIRTGVIGSAEDKEDLEQIATEAASGFDAFNSPFQEIVWTNDLPYDSLLGLMGAKKPKKPAEIGMVLSSAELAELAHPPDDCTTPHGVRVEKSYFKQIPLNNALTVEDPYQPHDGLIPIGIANPGTEDQEYIAFDNAQLDQHMLIVGKTGSGKSEWLKWACFGVAKAEYPFVIVDPHGALSDDILKTLIVTCPERVDDIVYCDLSDASWPVALNPLDINNAEQVDPTVNSIMEMLSSQMNLSSSGAPRAVMFARQALTALCYANIVLKDPNAQCTLLDVVKFFTNPDFRHLVVEFCENNSVKETFDYDHGVFENLSEKQQTEMSMPIVRAFSRLAESNAFAAVFSSPQNKLNFGQLVGSKKLVIVRLARHSSQRMLGQFVGSLILPWLLGSMDDWGRHKNPVTGEFEGTGVRVFVDEAPTLFGPDSSVPELLAEARKWDLGLIMAAQFLDQFDPSIIKASLANTASKIALATELNTAQIITKSLIGGNKSISPSDLADLPNYHYYGNILMPNPSGGLGASGAFSAKCLPPIRDDLDEETMKIREEVIARSRELVANEASVIQKNEADRINNVMITLREEYHLRAEESYQDDDEPVHESVENHEPGQEYSWDLDENDN
jgi:hypothetical protein